MLINFHHSLSFDSKETISSIRTDVFLQVIPKKQKAWHATAKHIKDITIPYIGIGITLPDKQDFKDIIVCFDDFERLSSSMELKEVLGLISYQVSPPCYHSVHLHLKS
jgi:hypothetical protein